MEFSVYSIKYAKILATTFSLFFHLHWYRQVASVFTFISDYSVKTTFTEMPSLIRKEKITYKNCGTRNRRNNIVRLRKRCSAGTLYCNHCPNFSTKSQCDLNYHIAKKHSAPKPNITFRCKLWYEEFPGFYALLLHRNTQHGMQIQSRTRDVDVEHIVGDVEDRRLREELRSCQHFLVDS